MRGTLFGLVNVDRTTAVKSFYNQYVNKETRFIAGLILLTALLGGVLMFINAITTHFSGCFYLPVRWAILSPCILGLTLFGLYARTLSPKLAFFTRSYGTYFFILVAFAILVSGIQYTPFATIDAHLIQWDQYLGFNTPALMHWTAVHPIIQKLFESFYEFLNIEMVLIPLLLGVFKNHRMVDRFFITILIAFLIGTLIYYFFPTSSPVSMFHSPYFLSGEHATYLKFYQIHHYQTLTSASGGLISFPSFHVIWAILLSYALFEKKWVFIPVAIINVFVILSTVFLGWHYLVDVFAGIVLAILSIWITHRIYAKHFV